MFYETAIIDGILMERSDPRGVWEQAKGKVAEGVNALALLTEEERTDVFQYFCTYCGGITEGDSCYCRREE